MLLSDKNVAAFIDQNFVPCWETVRPVPKVTIDFGDGRVMKRTLKGNTVMYVCLPDGRVVDALPGVYTPEAFLYEAKRSLEVAGKVMSTADTNAVRQWHHGQIKDAIAQEKATVSVSKAVMESPLLRAIGALPPPDARPSEFKKPFDRMCARMDDLSSRPLPSASVRRVVGAGGTTPVERGKSAVVADSNVNVAFVRPAAHLLLASYDHLPTPAECRDVVFKKLLHVPIDDPNLGLGDVVTPGTQP